MANKTRENKMLEFEEKNNNISSLFILHSTIPLFHHIHFLEYIVLHTIIMNVKSRHSSLSLLGVGRQRLRGGGRGLHLHGRLLHHVDDLGLGDGRGRVGRRHHRGGRIPGGWPAHAAAAESRSGRSAADVPASVDDQGEDGEGEEAHQDDDGVGRAAVGGHALGLRGEGGKYTN